MRVVVEADGGSRGNPGPAGYGAVVFDPTTGDAVAERAEGIGVATNNVAEYRAVLLGLELARSLGAREVEVVNDSELVARQIGGEYKVKHAGLKPLFAETMEKLRSFDTWSVRNVRRDVMHDLRELKEAGETGSDDEHRAEVELQKLTDAQIAELDQLLKGKEAEILEV